MDHGWPLWITAAPYVIAFAVFAFILDVQSPRLSCWKCMKAVDLVGIVSTLVMVVALVFALNLGGIYVPWTSVKVSSLLVIGCLAALVLQIHETKWTKKPLLPHQVIRRYSQKAAVLVCFTHGFVRTSGICFLAPFANSRLTRR